MLFVLWAPEGGRQGRKEGGVVHVAFNSYHPFLPMCPLPTRHPPAGICSIALSVPLLHLDYLFHMIANPRPALRLTSGRQTPHVVSVCLLAWGALMARPEPPPLPNSVSSTFSPPPPHRAAINIAAIGGFALYPPPSLSLRLPLRSLPLTLSLS